MFEGLEERCECCRDCEEYSKKVVAMKQVETA